MAFVAQRYEVVENQAEPRSDFDRDLVVDVGGAYLKPSLEAGLA
jgi:hypothetical protein